jgi:rhodanese-related sulfurtransferase
MSEVEKAILNIKDNLPNVTPVPPSQQTPQSSAQALKQRLEWGEVAFTIIDVRDRANFNQSHIMGAMPMSMDEIVDRAKSSLEPEREIYLYGENDEQTAEVAAKMREAGFQAISELRGGLAGWKAIGGPTEGTAELGYDNSGAEYNVKARLDKHAELSAKKDTL